MGLSGRLSKVNRCLTEGRRAFAGRLAGIARGLECERLAQLLAGLADGAADVGDLDGLHRHLRNCVGCRARLKRLRTTGRPPAGLSAPNGLRMAA